MSAELFAGWGGGHSGDQDLMNETWPCKALADRWEPTAQDTLYAFNDVHAMMTFVSDERAEAQGALLSANERYVESASDVCSTDSS